MIFLWYTVDSTGFIYFKEMKPKEEAEHKEMGNIWIKRGIVWMNVNEPIECGRYNIKKRSTLCPENLLKLLKLLKSLSDCLEVILSAQNWLMLILLERERCGGLGGCMWKRGGTVQNGRSCAKSSKVVQNSLEHLQNAWNSLRSVKNQLHNVQTMFWSVWNALSEVETAGGLISTALGHCTSYFANWDGFADQVHWRQKWCACWHAISPFIRWVP